MSVRVESSDLEAIYRDLQRVVELLNPIGLNASHFRDKHYDRDITDALTVARHVYDTVRRTVSCHDLYFT